MDYVRVPFDPPRQCNESGKAWRLWDGTEGGQVEYIPKAVSTLGYDDNGLVAYVDMPQDVAERKGLSYDGGHSGSRPKETVVPDGMSRQDWFTLGMAMALVIAGKKPDDEHNKRLVSDAVWVAHERVGRVLRELKGLWP